MKRTSFKRLWLLAILMMLGTSAYIYQKGQGYRQSIAQTERVKQELTQQLRTGSKLTEELERLNNSTIKEDNITMLDVLRYIGLEESEFTFQARNRTQQKVGNVELFVRQFKIVGELGYADALAQIDELHNLKKMAIKSVRIQPVGDVGDAVRFEVEGMIYGLEK